MRMGCRVLGGLLAVSGLLVGACGGGAVAADAGPAPAPAAGFPVRIENCGAALDVPALPTKVVTSNASGLEMLLWLGAQDRVLGTGFPPAPGALPPELADAGAAVPVLGTAIIPKETLLGSGADTFITTFSSMGSMGGAAGQVPTAEEYAAAGIEEVFLQSTSCPPRGGPVEDLSVEGDDIRRLGTLTGTSAKADELVAGMEATVDEVQAAIGPVPMEQRPSYFFFDVGPTPGDPMATCNQQVAHAAITLAGARNVFSDCAGTFRQTSWEEVVARDPDWIQLGVRNRGSVEANEAGFAEGVRFLKEFPATAGLAAVQQDRFLRIPSEVTTIAGVRNADTVRRIAATLYPDRLRAEQ
ncbi:ABC transporter substrate-binding protein [Pseudonocardia humida]|uniref:ABC transporter substrate-binding protein n=1 Tax=Pseudonocardia humida TaxID=2800819 RepID=A0ABT1A0E3_9PSEU|nr:ABC transporter substrate-binding protein [Pseudonocardia humida]MCO1656472.1 ABC transporter substrate-binding protein [Pseudonocardia humida]